MKSDFPDNLKRLRVERRLTLDELAEKINKELGTTFNKSMLSKWENGYEASLDSLKYLSKFFNVSLNELLGFNLAVYDERSVWKGDIKIPIVRSVLIKKPILSKENIIGYASKPPLSPISDKALEDLFYLKVLDDSMDIVYPKGSIVLVRKNINIQNADNAVGLIGEETDVIIREVQFEKNMLTLIPKSYNQKYFPQKIDLNKSSFQLIGKIIGMFVYI